MQDKQSYHKSAVEYNEGLAVSADALAETVENDEVKRWCRAVAKQHRFHAKRHNAALMKLREVLANEGLTQVESPIEAAKIEEEAVSV